MSDSDAAPGQATRRTWAGLGVIALPCMLYSMDLTVLNLAVPSISADLKPSSAQLLWIVDVYGFMVAGMLITMGTLGDRIGRRRLLLVGATAFGIASTLAAFSRSAEMLIAMRALLGIAGATLAPSTLSLIRHMFEEPGERSFAIGVWITSFSAGAAVGPVVGGVLLKFFWWGSVFLANVPVMLLLLALGPWLLPEYRDPKAGRLDLLSAALSLAAVLLSIYGVKRAAASGFDAPAGLCIAGGVVLGAVFVRRQATLAQPLIDLQLFAAKAFSGSLATYSLGCFTLFGIFLFNAQYLQLVLRLAPLEAGLWSLPGALAFVAGSLLSPWLTRRLAPRTVVIGGLVLAAVGFLLIMRTGAASGLGWLVAGATLGSLGLAPVFTLATDLVVGAAPAEHAGAAAAISETSSELGGALGIALFGSIGAAVYRSGLADGDARLADVAGAATSSYGAAASLAANLPRGAAAAFLAAARDAFMSSYHAVAAVGVATLVGAAMLAVALLPKKPAS